MTEAQKTLTEVFAQHFGRDDLEGAIKWAHHWYNETDMSVPDYDDTPYAFTPRAMAGHLSDYLEGLDGTEPQSYNKSGKLYYKTKHGSELYWRMF